MKDYICITTVVKGGRVVNVRVSAEEEVAMEHLADSFKNYNNEEGVTEIASFKVRNNGKVEKMG